jgi:hypothetical protein
MAGSPRSGSVKPIGDSGMQAIEEFLTTWAAAEQASDTGTWKLAAIHMRFIAGTRGAPPIPGTGDRADAEKSTA